MICRKQNLKLRLLRFIKNKKIKFLKKFIETHYKKLSEIIDYQILNELVKLNRKHMIQFLYSFKQTPLILNKKYDDILFQRINNVLSEISLNCINNCNILFILCYQNKLDLFTHLHKNIPSLFMINEDVNTNNLFLLKLFYIVCKKKY